MASPLTPITAASPFTAPGAIAELSALLGTPVRPASDIRILRDGAEAFPAMLELFDRAQRACAFENFIFSGDQTGRRFADSLSAAARRGVAVRVIYDPVGTMMVRGGSIAKVLAKDGVDSRPFRPLSPYSPRSWLTLKHRDHRKTLTVDDDVTIVGGLCISDNWAPTTSGGGGWRDTALSVRGSIAADVAIAFQAMWQRSERRDIAAPSELTLEPPAPPVALVAADRPGEARVSALYAWLAGRARTTFFITDAYLVAPPALLQALEGAARRGVEVRLLLPGRNNHPVAGAAARRIYQPLLDSGAHIHEWNGAMVHAKTAVVDGVVTLVGSSNLDPLSMQRNYELNLLVIDATTGDSMQRMFAMDLGNATEVDPAGWKRRPLWQRRVERIAAALSPDL
jgi:cardiolipin synthase